MSATEDRRAIQGMDCRKCGAVKGVPCRYSRGIIKGVHAKRVLDFREESERQGFAAPVSVGEQVTALWKAAKLAMQNYGIECTRAAVSPTTPQQEVCARAAIHLSETMQALASALQSSRDRESALTQRLEVAERERAVMQDLRDLSVDKRIELKQTLAQWETWGRAVEGLPCHCDDCQSVGSDTHISDDGKMLDRSAVLSCRPLLSEEKRNA